jgi:pSer/pThr/pTyr-binding forkhead associated (FHA) protein
VIEDLNSTNGIYVKSNRVRRHHLNDGDVVLIGKHELIYVDERAARGRHALSDTVPGLQALKDGAEERADAGEAEADDEEDDAQPAPLK